MDELVLKYARPSHRTLVFTEETGEWENSAVIELAKRLDAKFDRSYFVFSKLERYLSKFNNSRDLNRFLTSNPVDSQVWNTILDFYF